MPAFHLENKIFNLTAVEGRQAVLTCTVDKLQDRQVDYTNILSSAQIGTLYKYVECRQADLTSTVDKLQNRQTNMLIADRLFLPMQWIHYRVERQHCQVLCFFNSLQIICMKYPISKHYYFPVHLLPSAVSAIFFIVFSRNVTLYFMSCSLYFLSFLNVLRCKLI